MLLREKETKKTFSFRKMEASKSEYLTCEPLVCKPACSCTPSAHHHAVSHGGMHAHSGRQLWCQFSLIRGLFSDLLPGQAGKEVTSSKVCLSGDDTWMCWRPAPLPALYHHGPPPLPEQQLCLFSLLSFSSLLPVDALLCQRKHAHCLVLIHSLIAETPIRWRAGLETWN